MSELREECGVVGILGDPDAANLVYLGLFAQQHRGQEGCGIVAFDREAAADDHSKFHVHKSFGLVAESFNAEIIGKLKGEGVDRLCAVREPYGFRPLVIGKRHGAYVVASETCALDLMDAELVREVAPGEVVEIWTDDHGSGKKGGMTSHFPLQKRQSA